MLWSQTPVETRTLAISRPGLLPSALFHSVSFLPLRSEGLSLRSTTIHFSELYTEPVPSFHPAPDSRCRVCLWISLMSCWLNFAHVGLSADRLLRAGASSAKRLTVRSILPGARASPAKGCMVFTMCDHPLGNTIEFHLPFGRLPTIRASLGARKSKVIFLSCSNVFNTFKNSFIQLTDLPIVL